MNDDLFLTWFAGFVAGEGYFKARRQKRKRRVQTTLRINLRDDDLDILLEIQGRLGMGNIFRSPRQKDHWHDAAIWDVSSIVDCRRLVAIFDKHPVRAKKQRDYEVWREIVLENCKPPKERDLKKQYYLVDKLKLVRQYDPPELPEYEAEAIQLTLPEGWNEK